MKIYNCGIEDIQPGKYKYTSECYEKLLKKFEPQKETPYSVEIVTSSNQADAVLYRFDKKLDLVVGDLEKIETRLARAESSSEKEALVKAQKILEQEILLSDSEISSAEGEIYKMLQLLTFLPCVGAESGGNINALIQEILDKAKILLFYTAGKKEVHIWSVNCGESILEAAGKIHSDLRRGFIKGDVVNCRDLDSFHNFSEARSRGLMKVVDRDYIMQSGDIIEIRFNV